MTSPYARPDIPSLVQLERLVEALEKELGAWRDKGLKADQDLTPGKGRSPGTAELLQARQRVGLLEGENHVLQQRITAAREQIEQLKSRLRFVEEHDTEGAV